MSEMELYLRDLKPEVQRRVLRFLGLKSLKEGNLDIFPIATIPKPDDDAGLICSECAEEECGKKKRSLFREVEDVLPKKEGKEGAGRRA